MKTLWYQRLIIAPIGFATFLSIASVGQAAELIWSRPETIPIPSETLDWGFDLDSGVGGDFHLLISDYHRSTMHYGHRSGEAWSIEQVTSSYFDATGNYSLGVSGNEAVAMFYNPPTGSLWWGSSLHDWDMNEVLYGFPAEHIDLAVLNGELHVALIRTDSPPRVFYIYTRNGEWTWEAVAMVSPESTYVCIAIDDEGHTHIAWDDKELQAVRYAYRNGPEDYVVETIQTVEDCQFLDMTIITPNLPFLGILNRWEDELWCTFKIGDSWIPYLIAYDQNMYTAAMAVAGDEGISTNNIYFVYCAGGVPALNYAFWDNGWVNERIPGAEGFNRISQLAAAWDSENKHVGMAFTGTDNLPMNFMKGMTDLPQADINLDLLMNNAAYADGDTLWVSLSAINLGSARSADLYVILDIGGEYWFYPTWTHDPDHFSADFADLEALSFSIIDPVVLPIPLAPAGPFTFYAAAFESGTLDVSTLISNVESVAFSFI